MSLSYNSESSIKTLVHGDFSVTVGYIQKISKSEKDESNVFFTLSLYSIASRCVDRNRHFILPLSLAHKLVERNIDLGSFVYIVSVTQADKYSRVIFECFTNEFDLELFLNQFRYRLSDYDEKKNSFVLPSGKSKTLLDYLSPTINKTSKISDFSLYEDLPSF